MSVRARRSEYSMATTHEWADFNSRAAERTSQLLPNHGFTSNLQPAPPFLFQFIVQHPVCRGFAPQKAVMVSVFRVHEIRAATQRAGHVACLASHSLCSVAV
jgi:hypothetical protein